MSVLPRRQYGIAITLALAVVGAVVAGVVLTSSSRADEVDLTTAGLVPADAGVYIALNTDLDTSQWVTAFNLIERLGEEDPEAELRRSAEEEGGLDWEDDIAPFLGGNAAIFLRGFDINTFFPTGATIIRADDPEAALEVLKEQSGFALEPRDHEGTEYFADEFQSAFATILDGHLVVAVDEASLFDVIAVHNGDSPSLASTADFQSLRNELSRNFLSFVYLDSELLLDGVFEDDAFAPAFEEAGVDFALDPLAAVIGAEGNGFTFQGASLSDPGAVSPLLVPRESKFASVVPSDTAFFVSANGLGEVMRDTLDAVRDDADAALAESGFESVDALFEEAGRAFGLRSVEDLIELFGGETAVALWFPTGDTNAPEGLLLTEVTDEERARAVIDALTAQGGETETRDVAGVEMIVVTGDTGDYAIALDEATLLIGTIDGVTRTLEGPGETLAGNESFTSTVEDLPTALGSFGYFDLGSLIRLAENGVPPQLDRADEALKGMIINMVDERGVVRVSGVVTIAEEE